MGYLPNLLAGSSNDLSAIVKRVYLKELSLRDSTRYMVYVDMQLFQHPNRKTLQLCPYYGPIEFSIGSNVYRAVGDATNAVESAKLSGASIDEIKRAIEARLLNSIVTAHTVGGVWFAR